MRVIFLGLVALLVIACGPGSAPTRTPGSMDDVIANIVLQDVTVLRLTSGDPGCPSSTLHDNAVRLELAIGAQSVAHDVYLLRWRKPADFDSSAAAFDECVSEYEITHTGAQTGRLEVAPWRAYGPLWTQQLQQIIENALNQAGGG